MHTWFGYFDLSKTVSPTATGMFASGLLYKTLTHRNIENLQRVLWALSPAGEKFMNEQLRDMRNTFVQLQTRNASAVWLSTIKPRAAGLADYWERDLKEHRARLIEIVSAIGGSEREP